VDQLIRFFGDDADHDPDPVFLGPDQHTDPLIEKKRLNGSTKFLAGWRVAQATSDLTLVAIRSTEF